MDLYGLFAKPLQVTEVTIPTYSEPPVDEALQAELIEDLYTIWFSHPQMEQIIYWNMVDGYAAFRGFYGTYELEITSGKETYTRIITPSSKDSNAFVITLA